MTEHAGGLGDAPIDPRFNRKMNGLARALDECSLRGRKPRPTNCAPRSQKLERQLAVRLPADPPSPPVAPPNATSSFDLDAINREIKKTRGRRYGRSGAVTPPTRAAWRRVRARSKFWRLAGYPSPGAMSIPMGTKS
jgi:hypothetical protein